MTLSQLQIQHVRNLRQVKLTDLQRINVFYGENGSGKTSVLESIHLLGMARSFRANSVKSLITHGEQSCTVFGSIASPVRDHEPANDKAVPVLPLGVKRSLGGEVQIKVGGRPVRVVAELAEQLPLQVINADSFSLLSGSPRTRRQYLDWGVFHVEHRFFAQWQRFQRCIKQRNMLLRRGKISDQEISVWTRDLAASGSAVSEFRQNYFKLLTPRFKTIMSQLSSSLEGLELRYRQGWDKQLNYRDALENSASSDREQGYTHVGPQRADIRVLMDGHLAAETLSRGQQKLVVCGLKLAQGQLMTERGGGRSTYLVDDLPSELDQQHGRMICQLLSSMGAQVFITCVEQNDIRALWPEASELAMFHVEHGVVQPSNGSR